MLEVTLTPRHPPALALSILFAGVLASSCGLLPENQEYRSAVASDTAEAYRTFLERYPQSSLAADIRRRELAADARTQRAADLARFREELGSTIDLPALTPSASLLEICLAIERFRNAEQLADFVATVSSRLTPMRAEQLRTLAEIQTHVLSPRYRSAALFLSTGCQVKEVSYTLGMRGLVESISLRVLRAGPHGSPIAFGTWSAQAPSTFSAPLGATRREFPVTIQNTAAVITQVRRAFPGGAD